MAITWNPSDKNDDITLSNGNLQADNSVNAQAGIRATGSKNSGKWYWEVKVNAVGSGVSIGIGAADSTLSSVWGYSGDAYGYTYGGSSTYAGYHTYGTSYTTNDIIGIALDLANGKIWFAKNNVWQASGDPAAGTNEAFSSISGIYFPGVSMQGNGGASVTARFAAGDQTYASPSGFMALDGLLGFFDGKVCISPKTVLFDGKTSISPQTIAIDGKARVKSSTTKLLDGRSWVTNLATKLFDGKGKVRDASINLLDGRARFKDSTANCLDGKTRVKDVTTNIIDGKAILYPVLNGNIVIPLLDVEATVGLNLSFNESFPSFDINAFTGEIADLIFPFLNVDNVASVGDVLSSNLILPPFTLKASTGINGLATFPFLGCSGNALVGNLVNSNIGLPLVKINADALVNIISRVEASFPKLQIDAEGLSGILATGNSNLYSLHIISKGNVGSLASATISLPCLIVNGDLAHQITGITNITFPMISLFAKAATLTKGCKIIRYKRWR